MAILRIKWVGEPPILLADGFTVGNWKHENTRTVAVPGTTWRKINHKNFPKLSRSYVWGLDTNGLLDKSGKTLIQPVEERDWALIHEDQPKTIFRCRSGYHFGVYNAVGTGIVELRCPYTKCKKGKVKAVHYFDYGTGRLLETLWEFELK
jgi:hypothetical protein